MKLIPKPCPFCGKKPKVNPKNPDIEGDAWGEVVCENGRCVTYDEIRKHGVSVRDGSLIADERGSAVYKQQAIRRWNKRALKSR